MTPPSFSFMRMGRVRFSRKALLALRKKAEIQTMLAASIYPAFLQF
jgi:hypothetical protein